MGLTKIGLGGILTFNSRQAEASIGRTNRKFGMLSSQGQSLSTTMNGTGRSLMMAGMAMMPLTMGVAQATKNYNEFNKQMSAVRAVGMMNQQQFDMMRAKAIELGSATAFTATEAAKGMEELTRAGFNVSESIAASGAVLDLAASDNMTLANSARITANVIRAMGLSARDDATRVADVLALTSARSNTDVMALGEAFKMAASTSSMMGISLEESSAILGKLADAGLRGTQGGTAFNNMMNKLVRPTKKASKFMKDYDVRLTGADGKMRKITDIVQDMGGALNQIPDIGERTAMAMELTGLRGVKAVSALMRSLDGPNNLNKLEEDLLAASGAAKTMANERLNNMSGQITILKSAIEGFTIRLFDMFKSLDGSAIAPVVDAMTRLNTAWDEVRSAMEGGLTDSEQSKLEEQHGTTMIALVLGIRDGIDALRNGAKRVMDTFKAWAASAEETLGPDVIRRIVKLGVMLGGLAATTGPLVLAFGTILYLLGNMAPAVSAIGAILSGAFWPVVAAVAAGIIIFGALRKEGESLRDFAVRMWGAIKDGAVAVWEKGIKPLWEGMKAGWEKVFPILKTTANEVLDSIKGLVWSLINLWNELTGGVSAGSVDWKKFGETAVVWLGTIASAIGQAISFAVNLITSLVSTLSPVVVGIKNLIMGIWTGAIWPLLKGLKEGWEAAWPTLKIVAMEVFAAIGDLVRTLMELWGQMTGNVRGAPADWQEFGRTVVLVLGGVITVILALVKFVIKAIKFVIEVVANVVQVIIGYFKAVWNFMKRSISVIVQFFGGLIEAFKMLAGGDVLGALKTAGMAIINFLLSPIRLVVGAIADFIKTLTNMRAVKKLLPDSQLKNMREFAAGMSKFADQGITLQDVPAHKDSGAPSKSFLGIDENKGMGDDGSDELFFGSNAGLAGFGSEQLAKLQGERAAFDAQQQAKDEAEHKRRQDEQAQAMTDAIENATVETTVNSSVCVDGREMGRNQAKHQQDLADRLGAQTPPFVRRTSAEQGTMPPR